MVSIVPLDLSRTEDPFMACQVPEADITEICSNASLEQMPQSGTTWKEKPYGYMLRLSNNDIVEAECNIPETLPEIPKGGSTKFRDFYCTPKHDVNVVSVILDFFSLSNFLLFYFYFFYNCTNFTF